MKVIFPRILLSFLFVCSIFVSESFGQKKNIPVDKPVSGSKIPSDKKPIVFSESKSNLSPLEFSVFEEINQARKNPPMFIGFLEEYKKATKGNLISLPNRPAQRIVEGIPMMDEAIEEMKQISNLSEFELSDKLSAAAKLQLTDLMENPALGHRGKNGSTLKTRLAQFAAVEGKVAENICFRGKAGRDVVMTFIMDDGVKSRLHRRNIFNPIYKKFGVACGVGKNNEPLCVTIFAEKVSELSTAPKPEEF